jgi:hypothetical protein
MEGIKERKRVKDKVTREMIPVEFQQSFPVF